MKQRNALEMPFIEINYRTRVCLNYYCSIMLEVEVINNGNSIQLNVLYPLRNRRCIFCNDNNNLLRLFVLEYLYTSSNVYIAKSCR